MMPRLFIDDHEIEVPAGSTILDAASKLGLDIPTLCFAEGFQPSTSCMVCLVKLKDENRLVPSCATLAEDGMQIESETAEVHKIRRTALELLLSDHVGDCVAPCQLACPTFMDIPLMMRQVAAGELREAVITVKNDIALPATLGRVCPELCERACRRRKVDSSAAICLLKRYVADIDLASDIPYLPSCKTATGEKVAIVGTGPAGLSAAYHLLQEGYACTLFDDHDQPGGMLRYEVDEDTLPRKVLDAEIGVIKKMGACFRMDTRINSGISLVDLRKDFNAVLVAAGPMDQGDIEKFGLLATNKGIQIDTITHETNLPGIFAAGDAVSSRKPAVRAVADGKAAAACIHQYLSGVTITGLSKPFTVHCGRLNDEEIAKYIEGADRTERVVFQGNSAESLTNEQARAEASRCLHCDCGKSSSCKLRKYAEIYGARAGQYRGERKAFERHLQHTDIIYEPGKCILCGLCIQVSEKAGEPLGLTFANRGFNVRVDIPFNRSLADGLEMAAEKCVRTCPTGALARRTKACDNVNTCESCQNLTNQSNKD